MISDAHIEATHLRELIAAAREALAQAGFDGSNLAEQLEAALIAAREVETLRREVAILRGANIVLTDG